MVYVISIQPKGLRVERRYNEFVTFRAELIRLYPGFVVPPIPKKKSGKRLEQAFINKRRALLQEFLTNVLKHPLLRSTTTLMQFLSLEGKDWESYIKALTKAAGPKDVTEFKTMEGGANVELTPSAENYCSELPNALNALKGQYKEYVIR